jgi:hypothetical protein
MDAQPLIQLKRAAVSSGTEGDVEVAGNACTHLEPAGHEMGVGDEFKVVGGETEIPTPVGSRPTPSGSPVLPTTGLLSTTFCCGTPPPDG